MTSTYILIALFILIASLLSVIILGVSYVIAFQNPDLEKLSAYECGFSPFEEARHNFNVQFYLIAILFIVFDLEISYLFPWSVSLSLIGLEGYWTMFIFLFILTLGFLYEWKNGALDWI